LPNKNDAHNSFRAIQDPTRREGKIQPNHQGVEGTGKTVEKQRVAIKMEDSKAKFAADS
jgi:hypothetical protein